MKVLVVDDHPDYRGSLSYTISAAPGFSCCGEYPSVETALQSTEIPDVILLDINLSGMNGIEGIPKFRQIFPKAAILMLTVYDDNESIFQSILAGADGYLLKTTNPQRLIQSVVDAKEGGYPMSPSIAKQAMQFFKKYIPVTPKSSLLTEREREILQLLIDGVNNESIANKLFISIQTVRNHIRHIYEKLHVHSKSQAVVKAIKENLI